MNDEELVTLLDRQKKFFYQNKTLAYKARVFALESLLKAIEKYEKEIGQAK